MRRSFLKFFPLFLTFLWVNLFASELVFIDVGQGNSTIVKFRGAAPLVVDSGSSESRGDTRVKKSEFKRKIIGEIRSKIELFLSPHKIAGIDKDLNMIISHAHKDHYNLVQPVFENDWMKNKKIRFLLGGKKEDYDLTKESQKLIEVVKRYQQTDIFVRDFPDEDSVARFEYTDSSFKILTAPQFDGGDLNERSIVLRIQTDSISCILSGDATAKVTNHLLTRYVAKLAELKSAIYQACHHGADTDGSNDKRFIDAVSPECVVFSSGQRYHHPSSHVVRRVVPHIGLEAGKYHILRYHHDDGGAAADITDTADPTRVVSHKEDLPEGYVFGITTLKIFNTQDQRTIEFKQEKPTDVKLQIKVYH
jgi:beta-lactamase superfamily II metal-dependent hydrolase